jgi:hypothetical protein
MLNKRFTKINEEVQEIKPGNLTHIYSDPEFFKNDNALPLARIKKIMKLDDDVKVIISTDIR